MSDGSFRIVMAIAAIVAALSLYAMANMIAAAWLERLIPEIIPVKRSEKHDL